LKSTVTDDIATHAAVTATHGATGAVVGTTNTQTLSNKTIDNTGTVTLHDHGFTLQDDVDATRQAQFLCSGIATATTRTITLQNADITMESTAGSQGKVDTHAAVTATHGATGAVVGTTNTQALTNKTITGATNTVGVRDSKFTIDNGVTDYTNFSVTGTATLTLPSASCTLESTTGSQGKVDTHAAVTATHGATGAVVGTTNTQTLSNKIFDTSNYFDGILYVKKTGTAFYASILASSIAASRAYTLPDKAITFAGVDDVTTHAALTATHGVAGAIVGTTDTQTLSGKTVQLTILPADHSFSGETIIDTVGENVTLWNVLYLKSDGSYWKADADAATTMPGVVLCTGNANAGQAGPLLVRGFARDDTWTWTVGGLIYVDTTAGSLTQTAPSATGDQVQILGYAKTADVIFFNPMYNMVEIA